MTLIVTMADAVPGREIDRVVGHALSRPGEGVPPTPLPFPAHDHRECGRAALDG